MIVSLSLINHLGGCGATTDFMLTSHCLSFKVECYLWTPYNRKYRFGKLYLSANYACFGSHINGLVSLILPLNQVARVDKIDRDPQVEQVIAEAL